MAKPQILRFKNQSNAQHDFVLYQQGVNTNAPTLTSLAWFAQSVGAGSSVDIQWTIDYGFVWSEQNVLKPGTVFQAAEFAPANLLDANAIGLTCNDDVFKFTGSKARSTPAGSLSIDCDNTVPPNSASIGIAMNGRALWVAPAQPNYLTIFTPNPEYWISFGSFAQGQVIQPAKLANTAQVVFLPGVKTMTATLNANNTWTQEQGLN